MLMEIKDGAKRPSEQLLTPEQVEFSRKWKGELWVVRSREEALRLVGVLT